MPYPSAILLWQQSQEAWSARPGRDQYPLLRYCLDIKREKVKGFRWDGKFQLNLDIQVFRVPLALSTTSLVLSALQGVELVLRLGGAFSLDQALRDRQLTRPAPDRGLNFWGSKRHENFPVTVAAGTENH